MRRINQKDLRYIFFEECCVQIWYFEVLIQGISFSVGLHPSKALLNSAKVKVKF